MIGILLAVFAVMELDIDAGNNLGQSGSLFFFFLLTMTLVKASVFSKVKDDKSTNN